MKTFIWSNWIPNYADRMEAMGFADEILPDEVCEKLELAPMEAAKPTPVLSPSKGLKPFRHGEFAKWN